MPDIDDVLLGKYRLVKKLGAGGMGAVFEAVHEQIGKHVAVKVLHQDLTQKPELVARFTREAQAAAAIGHKAIIDIYDIGNSSDGSLFLVMEFLQGQNLAQALQQAGRPLDVNHALYVACQVLSALHSAHDKGIIHRDLKPDNIFLEQTGQLYPDVKLLDFGISKMLDEGAPEDRLTRTGTIMGTPFYMAPEQARGRKELDHRVDIYAMGVILYEALLGRVPFWADNTFALVYEILNTPLTPPRVLRPDMPEALEQIIVKALSRDANDRYQRSQEMLFALMPFLDDLARGLISLPQDVIAKGGPGGVDSVPGMSRGPSGAGMPTPSGAIATVGMSPAPSGVGVPTPSGVIATPGTPMAWTGSPSGVDSPPSKSKLGVIIAIAAVTLLVVVGGIIGLVVMLSGDRDEVAQPPPPVMAGGDDTTSTTQPDPTPDVAEEVAITLEGLPEGARVTLDGSAVEGEVVRLPRSEDERELRIEAPGLEPFTQRLAFDQDRTVTVAMVAARTTTTDASPTAEDGGPSTEVATAEEQEERSSGSGRSGEGSSRSSGRTSSSRRGSDRSSSRQTSTTPTKRHGSRRGVPQFDTTFQ